MRSGCENVQQQQQQQFSSFNRSNYQVIKTILLDVLNS